MEEGEKGSRKFIRLPVGALIDVVPTMDISKNPSVGFQQKGMDTCAYSSLASALYYLGYTEEAVLLHAFGEQEYKETNFPVDKTLPTIIHYINEQEKFRYFRKRYQPKKLKMNYNIFDDQVEQNEIRLIVLIMSDNTETHAVTIVNDFVFDANTTNALPLTIEGLDCCCGVDAHYIGVSHGYHWKFNY